MSVRVELTDLATTATQRRVAYLTSTDGTRVKVMQVHPRFVHNAVHVQVGPGTIRIVERQSAVVLVFPPVPGDTEGFTLLIDGQAQVVAADQLVITPTAGILHRRLSDDGELRSEGPP